jgi:hypothetical protein
VVAGEDGERGGLARAVGAEQAEALRAADAQAQVDHCHLGRGLAPRRVHLAQAADQNGRLGAAGLGAALARARALRRHVLVLHEVGPLRRAERAEREGLQRAAAPSQPSLVREAGGGGERGQEPADLVRVRVRAWARVWVG